MNEQIRHICILIAILFLVIIVIQGLFLGFSNSTNYEIIDIVFITFPALFGVIISVLGASLLDKIQERNKSLENEKHNENMIRTCLFPELFVVLDESGFYKVKKRFEEKNQKIQYGINKKILSLKAFDEIKFVLAKNNSKLISIIFDMYSILFMVNIKGDWEHIEIEKLEQFIENYNILISQYDFEKKS